ncbi:MAG: hypothetical protein ACLGPL_08785, partial [Acidobacteriota bacterium]
MKWRNHALMGASIAVMMDLKPAEILYCFVGANLPDQLESIGRVRIIPHRTITHELFLWLVPFAVLLFLPDFLSFIPRVLSVSSGRASYDLLTI